MKKNGYTKNVAENVLKKRLNNHQKESSETSIRYIAYIKSTTEINNQLLK